MKKLTFYTLIFASVWMMVSCNNQPVQPTHTEDKMIADAKAVDAKFLEAMNSKNADAVMSCYWNSPELVMYPPGELELKGYDAAKASFTKFFQQPGNIKHEMTEPNYKVAGDVVIGWGKIKITIPGADNVAAPMVMEGRYTEVLAYKDNNLVYIVDHASLPMPEPAAPEAEAKK